MRTLRIFLLAFLLAMRWETSSADEGLSGDYFLVAADSLKALTVMDEDGGETVLGQALRRPGPDAAQLWTLIPVEGGGGERHYRIQSKYDGSVLSAADCDRKGDVSLELVQDSGSSRLGWTVRSGGRGHRIATCAGTRMMAVAEAEERDHAKIELQAITEQESGRWLLYPAVERHAQPAGKAQPVYDNGSRRYRIAALPSAQNEEIRLDRLRLVDYQPSGLYVRAGETISVTVRGLAAPPDGLAILVGPIGGREAGEPPSTPQSVFATPGQITFVAERDGVLYFRYLDTGFSASVPPPLEIEVAGGAPIPLYVLGRTRLEDWLSTLAQAPSSPVVELVSERAIITATRSVYRRSEGEDPAAILGFVERLIAWCDEISGLDSSSPLNNPSPLRLHYRQEQAFLRIRGRYAIDAGDYAIRMSEASMADLLNAKKNLSVAWSIWCATGRAYEKFHWPREIIGENSASIYALHAAEKLGVDSDLLMNDNHAERNSWQSIVHYFTPEMHGFGGRESGPRDVDGCRMSPQLALYEQLRHGLGKRFYPRLHQYYRAHPLAIAETGDDEQRLQAFVLRASIVAGRDLSSFFRDRDLPVAATTRAELRRRELPPVDDSLFANRPE